MEFYDGKPLEDQEEEAKKANTPEAFSRLGDVHLARGRIEVALQRYRKAVSLAGDDPAVAPHRASLGDAYVYADQSISALREYRRAIRKSPRRAQPHFSMAELYRR